MNQKLSRILFEFGMDNEHIDAAKTLENKVLALEKELESMFTNTPKMLIPQPPYCASYNMNAMKMKEWGKEGWRIAKTATEKALWLEARMRELRPADTIEIIFLNDMAKLAIQGNAHARMQKLKREYFEKNGSTFKSYEDYVWHCRWHIDTIRLEVEPED